MILSTLQEIDKYNLEHEDAKMLDKDKFIGEVMKEFEVKEKTATEWVNDCMKMNRPHQEYMIKQEKVVRVEREKNK